MTWKVYTNKGRNTGLYRFAVYKKNSEFKLFSSYRYTSSVSARKAAYKAIIKKMREWDIYHNF